MATTHDASAALDRAERKLEANRVDAGGRVVGHARRDRGRAGRRAVWPPLFAAAGVALAARATPHERGHGDGRRGGGGGVAQCWRAGGCDVRAQAE